MERDMRPFRIDVPQADLDDLLEQPTSTPRRYAPTARKARRRQRGRVLPPPSGCKPVGTTPRLNFRAVLSGEHVDLVIAP